MIRKPVVAGQFYERSREKLLGQIEWCFRHPLGPGSLPKKERKGFVKGAISPHAGYMFSGPCMAHVYKEIAEAEFPDLYLFLGPSHIGFHKTCFSMDDWETPLGLVRSDEEFGKILEDNNIDLVPIPHNEEHSIEVQLPFLQYASGEDKEKIRFIPIMVAEDWQDSVPLIKKSILEYEKKKRRVCIIASSDFTHYGFNYGYTPFLSDIRENLHRLDNGAIDEIKKLNVLSFINYCETTGATICGRAPIAALLTVLKDKVKKAELLKYYTSGDMVGDHSSAVGYAGIVFR